MECSYFNSSIPILVAPGWIETCHNVPTCNWVMEISICKMSSVFFALCIQSSPSKYLWIDSTKCAKCQNNIRQSILPPFNKCPYICLGIVICWVLVNAHSCCSANTNLQLLEENMPMCCLTAMSVAHITLKLRRPLCRAHFKICFPASIS